MKRVLVDNLPLKLLSVFLALILFVLVREDRVKEFELDLPILQRGMPSDFVLVEDLPKRIEVRVRGKWSSIMRALERKNRPFVLDLTDLHDGDVVFFDETRLGRLLSVRGLTIVSVKPRSANIRMEAKIQKRVPVRLDLIGEPARGYELMRDGIVLEPSEITIKGTAESVRAIDDILTVPVNISGLDRDLVRQSVSIRQPAGATLELETQRVRVEIPVKERIASDIVAAAPVELRSCTPPNSCAITPQRVPVQLRGPELWVEQTKADAGRGLLWLDVSAESLRGGVYPGRLVRVTAPPGVVVTLSVPTVTLTVTEPEPVRDFVPGAPDAGSTDDTVGGSDVDASGGEQSDASEDAATPTDAEDSGKTED